jgi:hypothetical protein
VADDNIITSISLQGAPEMVAQFAAIEGAASRMFETLSLMGQTDIFGSLALGAAGAVAAFSAVSTSMLAMSQSAVAATTEVAHLADRAGLSVGEMSGLQGAMAALGAGGSDLENVFGRLSARIESSMDSISDSIRKSSTQATSDLIAISDAELALEHQSENTAFQMQHDALSVQAARQGLTTAQGGTVDPAAAQNLKIAQQQLALNEALAKQATDAEQAPTRQLAAENKLAEARLKNAEDQANSITNLKQFVNDLSQGLDTTGQKVNLTSQNLLKGLTASLMSPEAVAALKNVDTAFDDVTRKSPEAGAALFKLADVFKNLNDESLKTSVAIEAFGRGVSAAFVDAMSKGSDGLQTFIDRQKDLGLVVTANDVLISKQFTQSLNLLKNDIGEVARQFGLLFAPGFTQFFTGLDQAVVDNREKLLGWGAAIRDTVMPILNDFIVVISGKGTLQTTWVNDLIQGFIQVGSAIKTAAVDIFNVFQTLAGAINSVFGTDVSGTTLLVGFVLFRSQVLGLISLLAGPLLAAINGVFAAAAGVGAVGGVGATALFGGLTVATIGLGAALEQVIEKLITGKAPLADYIGQLISGKKATTDAGTGATGLTGAINKLNQELASGKIDVDTYQQKINDLVRAFTPLDTAAKQVAADFDALAQQVTNAAQKTAAAVQSTKDLTPRLGETTAQFQSRTGTGPDLSTPPAPQLGETTAQFNARVQQFNDLTAAAAKSTTQVQSLSAAMDALAQKKLQGVTPQSTTGATGATDGTTISLEQLKALSDQLPQNIEDDVNKSNEEIKGIDFTPIKDGADNSSQSIDKISTAVTNAQQPVSTMGATFTSVFSSIGSGVSSLLSGLGNLVVTSAKAEESITGLQQQNTQLTLNIDVQPLLDSINNAKAAMLDLNNVTFDGLSSSIDNVVNRFQQMAQAAQSAADASAQAARAQSSSDSGAGFARGGLFRGRLGRDTNLAWLTDFEYVMRPEAVQKYGLSLMHMINSLQFPLGGFRFGGLVLPRMGPIPAFAAGGLNRAGGGGSSRTLNLTIGAETFSGLIAPEEVAKQLERASVKRQLGSTGVKPRWVR